MDLVGELVNAWKLDLGPVELELRVYMGGEN